MSRRSPTGDSGERKPLKKYGKAAAKEALVRKLAKQAPSKMKARGAKAVGQKVSNSASESTVWNASALTATGLATPAPSAKRERSGNAPNAEPLTPAKKSKVDASASLIAGTGKEVRIDGSLKILIVLMRAKVTNFGLIPMWLKAQRPEVFGEAQAGVSENINKFASTVPANQSKAIQSSPPVSPPSTPSPLPGTTPPALAGSPSSDLNNLNKSSSSDTVVSPSSQTPVDTSSGTSTMPATAQGSQQVSVERQLPSPYDAEKAPDWRTAPLWTYSVLQKAGIDKQGAIRYVRLGLIKEFLAASGDDPYGQDSHLILNLTNPFSAIICGARDAPTSRITRTLLEHLLTRHGQRCEKSRLGLVLRLAPDDPAPRRISALSNAGEGFVHPPTVDVFVEPRFVDDVRDRYEVEDLQYMVTVRALCVPANYFDDVSFVRNAFAASGDRLPAKARSLARAAINAVVAGGRAFEFATFKREIARLTKDVPLDETAELHERIRVIESFFARPGQTSDVASMFARELTVVDLWDAGVCEEVRLAMAELIVRKFVSAQPERAGVPLFDDKVLVVEEYDRISGRTAVLRDTLVRVMREKEANRTTVLLDMSDPTMLTRPLCTTADMSIFHRQSAILWPSHVLLPILGPIDLPLFEHRFARLTAKEAMVCAPNMLVGKSTSPGAAYLGADLMKVIFK
ncbi:uncharacterized protein SCHCODRAFT_01193821 [Schizophyllum commune H4-8]|uniref:uncharacterized protein n=1 Tax=Schizophyllum commune (strain H4-8 / FGSC 9210) TaxID=578458 RepID=UPI00215E2D76|nr:uncharacterized protein SCHCODRAFT_01193821 [Schizophyllum commune H4-8]KAI5886261.1 hypothetical protein SCHCODRAFT_01193821 [Schizophyllum commune H4-8]